SQRGGDSPGVRSWHRRRRPSGERGGSENPRGAGRPRRRITGAADGAGRRAVPDRASDLRAAGSQGGAPGPAIVRSYPAGAAGAGGVEISDQAGAGGIGGGGGGGVGGAAHPGKGRASAGKHLRAPLNP